MKKFLLPLLLALSFVASYAQTSTVSDEIRARKYLTIPKYATLPATGNDGLIIQITGPVNTGMWQRLNGVWAPVGGSNAGETKWLGEPQITWSGNGLTYDYLFPAYLFNGKFFMPKKGQFTLSPSPVTQSRIDVVAVDSNGNTVVITGDSSLSPVKNSVDFSSQLEAGSIYLNPGDTTPSNLKMNWVYREGVEWDTSSNISGAYPMRFRSTISPHSGSYNVKMPIYVSARFSFTNITPVFTDTIDNYSFWIKTNTSSYFRGELRFYNGSVVVKGIPNVMIGQYGFIQLFAGWQKLSIPVSVLGKGKRIDKISYNFGDTNYQEWQLDDASFQGNVSTIATPDAKYIGAKGDTGVTVAKNGADILNFKGTGGIKVYADENGLRVDGSGIVGGGGGGGNGITKVLAGWGVVMVNDSMPRVDSLLILSKLRFKNSMDSLAVVLAGKVNISDFNDHKDSVATALNGKAANSNTVTINGNTQTLGSNPNFTVSGGAGTTHIDTVFSKNNYFLSASVGAGNGLGVDSVKYRYPSVLSGYYADTVRNFSIAGARMQPNLPGDSGYLPQVRQIPRKRPYDRYLIIEPSGNDIGWNQAPYDTTAGGTFLRAVIDTAIARGWPARSIMVNIIPVLTASQRAFYGTINGVGAPSIVRCDAYRKMYRDAAINKGTRFTDLQKQLDIYGESAMYSTSDGDGFHPGRYGQNRAATAMFETLFYGTDSVGAGGGTTLNGTGFVKASGTTISYDNSTYITNQTATDEAKGFRIAGNGIFNGGKVGIGTASPSTSAIFEMVSTSSGLLVPRMNGAQQNLISSPSTGLTIYNIDTVGFTFFTGSAWRKVGFNTTAGANTEVQFNDNGQLGASRLFTFNPSVGTKGALVDSGKLYIGDTIRNVSTASSSGYLILGTGNTRLQGLTSSNVTLTNNSVAVTGTLSANTGFNATNTATFNIGASVGANVSYGIYRATGNFSTGTTGGQSSLYKIYGTVTGGSVPELIGYHDSLIMSTGTKYTSLYLTSTASARDYTGIRIAPVSVGGTNYALIAESGSVGLGTPSPNPAALVDEVSTTKGHLIPRHTNAQRVAMTPVEGLEVYDTDYHAKMVYDGTRWTGYRYNGIKFQGYDGTNWLDLN